MMTVSEEHRREMLDELRGYMLEQLPFGEKQARAFIVESTANTVKEVEQAQAKDFHDLEICLLHLFLLEAVLQITNEVLHIEYGMEPMTFKEMRSNVVSYMERANDATVYQILDKARPYLRRVDEEETH